MTSPARVLHLIHDSTVDPKQFHLGSTKGIRCRTEYFEARGIQYDEIPARRSANSVLLAVSQAPLERYGVVVFEHSQSPAAMRLVRRRAPWARIVLSVHNAELYHRVDFLRAEGLSRQTPRMLKHLLTRPLYDLLCGRLADFVVAVSEWEVEHYWSRFLPPAKVRYMPWHLPELYRRTLPSAGQKKAQCVCLMSTAPNALVRNAGEWFARAVSSLGDDGQDWRFLMTGDRSLFPVPTGGRITWTGFLESPYPVLAESTAMALLTNYGYGFKTKIMEAILTRTYTFVGSQLFERLPESIKPYCIPVVLGFRDSFIQALKAAERPFPPGSPNEEMRDGAFRVLDEVIGLTPGVRV
jgi:glycosyltransferase involved in cell wall biosynthesis